MVSGHQLSQALAGRHQLCMGEFPFAIQLLPQGQCVFRKAVTAILAVVVVKFAALHKQVQGGPDGVSAGRRKRDAAPADTAVLIHIGYRQVVENGIG